MTVFTVHGTALLYMVHYQLIVKNSYSNVQSVKYYYYMYYLLRTGCRVLKYSIMVLIVERCSINLTSES